MLVRFLACCWLVAVASTLPCIADDTKTVKVFVLAGQSNMEGKAANTLLDYQATNSKTKDFYAHLRDGDQWRVRDDVFIKFLSRKGPLTVGFGSPKKTGAELEFGHILGEHFDEPVLLIKTAWGGHSLYQKFRSPSSGLPPQEHLDAELDAARKRVEKNNERRKRNDPMPTMDDIKSVYGISYRNMMSEIEEVRNNYETMFPELKGKKLDWSGFFWFQGFNDQFGEHAPGEYATNMQNLIKDVRKDLNAPEMPVVIAAIGTNMSKSAKGACLEVRNAQLAMNDVPEFKGNVVAFRTDVLVDKSAEALIDGWQNHVEEWKKVGSDRPYHYLGSGIWYSRIGREAAKSMLRMLD